MAQSKAVAAGLTKIPKKKTRLIYAADDGPGFRRIRAGRGFRYVSGRGRNIANSSTLARIQRLAIPPAWQEVWICRHARGHLQATGRDARGRKQYIYHPHWRQARDETKFDRMILFGQSLGKLRARVRRDLRRPGLPREKVIATIVRLLQVTLIRVGNEDYARQNGSFGLTTFHDCHAKIRGPHVCFHFPGKSGIRHDIELCNRRLAAIVKGCQELPGQELFQFVNEAGERGKVKSEDVNHYLKEAMGQDFTAKDFRTWAGTVLASVALVEQKSAGSQAAVKRNVVKAITQVAQRLGNTKTVCRKSYIHPAVIECYQNGMLAESCKRTKRKTHRSRGPYLSPDEAMVLRFLRSSQAN